MECLKEFDDIRPFCDNELHDKLQGLIQEPHFERVVRYVLPDVNYPELCQQLLSLKSTYEFQVLVMKKVLDRLVHATTKGLSGSYFETIDKTRSHTFMSNHRDIVLDASFLNLLLLQAGLKTCEIAIGNNLLIFDWISDLVRINKSFIVKRNVGIRQMLEAAKQLSAYIHYAIAQKNESVWIAQREGRSKDSDDRTQESLIKMLSIAGEGDLIDRIKAINIVPVSISYEYDPCDYLKAQEFLMKRDNPDFKKSEQDDLQSMEVGLLGFKGRVHFGIAPCINDELNQLEGITDKAELLANVLRIIDKGIHSNYMIYPGNYVAYDLLNHSNHFADQYTAEEKETFINYLNGQLAKLPETSAENRAFLQERILTMYANPLKNKLVALGQQA